MIGIDTSFLVCFEVSSHPLHRTARTEAAGHAAEGVAIAGQVLAEFVHVVTDPRRFARPLPMADAMERCQRWWSAAEVTRLSPTERAVSLFFGWMKDHGLGRKRILDTMLAATYRAAGISLILTTDARDFAIFPGLHPVLVR
jgi:predicted nucleic acid-binding protein